MNFFNIPLLDDLFPAECPVCGRLTDPDGPGICRKCAAGLSFIREPRCRKCGKKILTESQVLCNDCHARPKSFTKGFSLLNYDDAMIKCMAKIKYKNKRDYIPVFAGLMSVGLGEAIRNAAPELLVPVPVHKAKLRERGFNQAELLAKDLSARLDIPMGTGLLVRNKKTLPQKDLDPDERLENLNLAFSPGVIPPGIKCVMLVDDIYTTGATAEACTRILLNAGIGRVYICSICSGAEY